MRLAAMRYKDYIWPHNPASYSITYERQIAVHKVPFGRYCVQDLGQSCRVMRGEGTFAGAGAYEEFKRLATVFYNGGPGLLIHPVWQASNAYFTALKLEQEPLPDYVHYSFEFRESFDGYPTQLQRKDSTTAVQASEGSTTTYTVVSGDTLWAIAQRCGTTLQELLSANPAIQNPNLIYPGMEVVIPC